MHNLIDLRCKKNGNDSVNFIGSFDNLVMSNILDILPLAAGLRLSKLCECMQVWFACYTAFKCSTDRDIHVYTKMADNF